MKILIITPPIIQPNSPYPASAYLYDFLRKQNYTVSQKDASIELLNRIFTRKFFEKAGFPSEYSAKIEAVLAFLQNKNPVLAERIASGNFLPQGRRFGVLDDFENNFSGGIDAFFGEMGIHNKAVFLASLFIDDCCDFINENLDSDFQISKYAEKIAACQDDFSEILAKLNGKPTEIQKIISEIVREYFEMESPDYVFFTIPFPGTLFSALFMAREFKKLNPKIKVVFGGGFVSTELREIKDKRFFEFADYVVLDGLPRELPRRGITPAPPLPVAKGNSHLLNFAELLQIIDNENSPLPREGVAGALSPDGVVSPDFLGLPLDKYFGMAESVNLMHDLWGKYRWNKIMLAHGCYWHRCKFCDTSLDYIKNYQAQNEVEIVNQMEKIITQTGQTGFHFVDEAIPPKLALAVADEILRRNLVVSWWGNIRFEKFYTKSVCETLAKSGCIAVSGGLEGITNKMMDFLDKGITIETAVKTMNNFAENGILIHAYLMFGIPSQTVGDLIDGCEILRQCFEERIINSAFWHRFSATIHSPFGQNPEKYGIKILTKKSDFCNNDLKFIETDNPQSDNPKFDWDEIGNSLKKMLYNFQLGIGIDFPIREWFAISLPKTKIDRKFVRNLCLSRNNA